MNGGLDFYSMINCEIKEKEEAGRFASRMFYIKKIN